MEEMGGDGRRWRRWEEMRRGARGVSSAGAARTGVVGVGVAEAVACTRARLSGALESERAAVAALRFTAEGVGVFGVVGVAGVVGVRVGVRNGV
jgi:hypothetical protein